MTAAPLSPPSSNRVTHRIAIVVLLMAAVYQLSLINHPFERSSEGCGAYFGLLARNYFRYPLSVSHAIPIMSDGQGAPPTFYANHPPTTPLLIVLMMKLAGYHGQYDALPPTWTIRLPSILATLGCGWTLYVMLRNRLNGGAGAIATAIFFATPMSLMYGGFPDVISPQLCLGILLTIAAYERLADQPTWRNGAIACAAFASAGLIDWPAFYVLPVLAIHCLCTQSIRRWPVFIVLGLFGTALFAALYAYLTIAQPDWRWMITQILKRSTGHEGDYTGNFTFAMWCRQALWVYGVGRHTLIATLIGIVGVGMMIARRFAGSADRFAGLLIGWAALHVLIGRQGVYQHEWWWWPLTPALSVAAALGIETALSRAKRVSVSCVVAGFLAAFAIFNIVSILQERFEPSLIEPGHHRGSLPGPLNYTLVDLGQVVRDNVPADTIYLITEDDLSLASWYYCDRAVRRHVWDVNTMQQRLKLPGIDLSFDLYAEWNAPVSRIVVPKIYLSYAPQLVTFLDAHYSKRDLPKFLIYDLTQATKP